MSKIIRILLLFILFGLLTRNALAVSYPDYTGYVNDFASLYSSDFKDKLEGQISEFEKQTGAEIAVVTIKSLNGENLEDYAVELFEKWKIGKKGEDNGLLLLISQEDRAIRIEVGYGLEPYITDGRAGDVIRNSISPEFKNGNYENGTMNGILALEKYIEKKDIAPIDSGQDGNAVSSTITSIIGRNLVVFPVLIYFLITYLASFLGRTKEIWPGGAFGAVIGIVIGIIAGSILLAAVFAVFSGFFGLFLDFILSKNYKSRKEHGKSTGWWDSGGGFFGGGGGWGGGGGSGSGGFGGFGGGSSGGGGASGRW